MSDSTDTTTRATRRAWLLSAYPYATVLAATCVLAALFWTSMLQHTGGQLGAPIDDAFIYANYGRHTAAGHPFEYNPGEGVTTGATSTLWTLVCALGAALGFTGEGIIRWTFGLETVCLFLYGALLYRIGLLLFGGHRLVATLIALAVMLEGRVLWGFFSGMDIAVYHALLASSLYRFGAYQEDPQRRHAVWLAISLGLLALVRPEAQILALLLAGVFVLWRLARGRSEEPPRRWLAALSRPQRGVVLAPIAVIALLYALQFLATGEMSQSGMRTKSPLFAPGNNLANIVADSWAFYRRMLLLHFPWWFGEGVCYALDVLLFAGFAFGTARELRARRPGIHTVMALWFFLGLLVQAIVLNVTFHHGRYQMNYTFVWWLVFFSGLHAILARVRALARHGPLLLGAAACLLLVPMGGTVAQYRERFGKDVSDIQRQHVAMGRYIAAHLPRDAVVAINDAGAIAYYGERRVYDLYGLTTKVAAEARWGGEACIFETIAHLDPNGTPPRPDWFAIYDTWYPKLATAGFLTEVHREHVPPPNICASDDKILYRLDWSRVGAKDAPRGAAAELGARGLRVVDRLDVAYLPDESAHGWRLWRKGELLGRGSDLLRYCGYAGDAGLPIIEGGRTVVERCDFTVRGLTPGKPLWIVRRSTGPCAAAVVSVNGTAAGTWQQTDGPRDAYRDDLFEVDARFVTAATAHIELDVAAAAAGSGKRATGEGDDERTAVRVVAYHFWFAQ